MASSRKPGPLGTNGAAPFRGGTLSRGVADLPGPARGDRRRGGRSESDAARGFLGAKKASAAPATQRADDPKLVAQGAAIAKLPAKSEDFAFQGQTYRVVRGIDWQEIGPGQRYQMLRWAEARDLFNRMIAVPAIAPVDKAALQAAAALLQDSKLGPIENGLALLRLLPVTSGGAVAEAPITPSQFRKLLKKNDPAEEEVHWVEIQLVDEGGEPVPDAEYVITTPDNTDHKGTTDEFGFGRIEGIVAGQCKIRFPGLDQDAWSRLS